MKALALAALAALPLGACGTPPLPEVIDEPAGAPTALDWSDFELGPNDVLRVGVFGHPELGTPLVPNGTSGTRVDPDGNLQLPLVGAVAVAGLSLEEAREAIQAAHRPWVIDPRVDVSVVEFAARRFYLYGEVREPGAYAMDRPLNVYQALAFGGGFAHTADRSEVALLRPSPEGWRVHLIDGASPGGNGRIAVRPDDLLFVRRSRSGRFAEEVLPILSGISSSLGSIATVLLIEDQLDDDD